MYGIWQFWMILEQTFKVGCGQFKIRFYLLGQTTKNILYRWHKMAHTRWEYTMSNLTSFETENKSRKLLTLSSFWFPFGGVWKQTGRWWWLPKLSLQSTNRALMGFCWYYHSGMCEICFVVAYWWGGLSFVVQTLCGSLCLACGGRNVWSQCNVPQRGSKWLVEYNLW